jgi:hypothetical protein
LLLDSLQATITEKLAQQICQLQRLRQAVLILDQNILVKTRIVSKEREGKEGDGKKAWRDVVVALGVRLQCDVWFDAGPDADVSRLG